MENKQSNISFKKQSGVDARYEVWKNKLLDLGKGNKLLNYKETAKSTLKITFPIYKDLYRSFVQNECTLTFPLPSDEDKLSNVEINAMDNVEKIDEERIDHYKSDSSDFGGFGSDVRTNKKSDELQKVLRNLRSKAKVANEERGINILYLCFGFLKWKETDHSSKEYLSPLILVPVSLSVESITAPYTLSLYENEIVVNPTLRYKLENDFGLKLPEYEESAELDQFFTEVNENVKAKGWEVIKEVGMSLLSFLKMNMYDDLVKNRNKIVSNPVVMAIAGNNTSIPKIPDYVSAYDFDRNERPQDVFQVIDADASQQEAILMAKRGVSFILQGPPGTGKSQTITNIIAEKLAAGEKVLFVSEKMAALDVVYRRLTEAELNDFCLVLHSLKTNKKSVLDQLEKVLDLSNNKVTITEDAYQKLGSLEDDRQKLNDYAEQLFKTVAPLGKSIYEANGIVANLENYENIVFDIPDIKNTTKEQYNRYIGLLNRFASTIGKMTNDYKNNPWYGSILSAVSYKFRHDVEAKMPGMISTINKSDALVKDIFEYICSAYERTFNGIETAIRVLKAVDNSYEIPVRWIIDDEELPTVEEIEIYSDSQKECRRIAAEINEHYTYLIEQGVVSPVTDEEWLATEVQRKQIKLIMTKLAEEEPFYRWKNVEEASLNGLFSDAKMHADNIKRVCEEISDEYEDSIFKIDYDGILNRIKTEYTSFFKVLKKQYKEDKKAFLLSSKKIERKITDEEMLSTIKKLKYVETERMWFQTNEDNLSELFGNSITSENSDYEVVENQLYSLKQLKEVRELIGQLTKACDEFVENEVVLRNHYEFLYNGIFTDWKNIKKAFVWANAFRHVVSAEKPSRKFVEKVCRSKEYARSCFEYSMRLSEVLINLREETGWIISVFEIPQTFDAMLLTDMEKKFTACRNGLSQLEEWIDFRSSRRTCCENGLVGYMDAIEKHDISHSHIVPVFQKRFFRLWLDEVTPDYPAVYEFRRKFQEQRISEFAKLDVTQFKIARGRIRSKLINRLPSMDHFTNGLDEVGILKRELKKQRKIMPIRKLFREIPNLLLTLKPCLMMSPLSVSQFLESDSYKFDTVIFDEASQVCTENAIGAISRGKQVIIAGDSKQLPPTSFFQTTLVEENYNMDDEEDDVFDSILDEANMLPERTLRWHYRSRHESLIAFSNSKIYKKRLITFPSNTEGIRDTGVEYVHVPGGVYDRGGHKGNEPEACKVADLVFEHLKKYPDRSLGVITFGEVQQNAIETVIRERRIADQQYENMFSEDKEEPFFVKSLENVQGDERDTIIFSIGYAPDATGVFRMNFGPLGKAGGERRLNVAITRAKYNVKLVGSILPTDIDIDKITMDGPKLLRSYMEFAIKGGRVLEESLPDDVVNCDSPFEESVYNFLDRKGYKVTTQVGCSSYRIDIGVKHPKLSGVYVLGVECDGASYHSARTARERDRLRQDVLEGMGWRIYRVWSTDWIKDSAAEGQKLIDAIEDAVSIYESENKKMYIHHIEAEEEFIQVEKKNDQKNAVDNNYGFPEYIPTDFSKIKRNRWGYLELSNCVMALISNEFPIHYELICQRCAVLCGNEKVTVKVKGKVNDALENLRGEVKRDGDFLFPAKYDRIPIKIPNKRKIQHIHEIELAAAMRVILSTYVGPSRKALADETARVYGFSRSGPNITNAMEQAINYLINMNYAEEIEGKLRLK